MVYEWNAAKAKANLHKHGVSFEEATTIFLDPSAWTFPDPDHSAVEAREITIGYTMRHRLVFVAHCQRGECTRIISAGRRPRESASNMRKVPARTSNDDLRPEYDLARLTGSQRGKYYRQATAGTNLVLIEPELARVFRDSESVNRALRLLVDTAASATPARRPRRASKKRLQSAP